MARLVFAIVTVAVSLAGGAAASGQGKDPFRPPGTGVAPAPGNPAAPGEGAVEPSDGGTDGDDGLANTGQDLAAQAGIGLAMLALGSALRLVAARGGSLALIGRARPA